MKLKFVATNFNYIRTNIDINLQISKKGYVQGDKRKDIVS